jgi:transmembrane sensor
MRLSSQEIDRQAAEWAAKMAAGSLTPEEQASFESWLAADIRHLGAYGRAEAVLARLDRLRAVGTGALHPASHAELSGWTRRRVLLTGSTAAGLAAASVVGTMLWKDGSREDFATEIGNTRVVALSDGSIVTLNTNSKVSVRFTRNLRKVDLVQGEALFNVAKNKERPFIVFAGDTQVRAVGTSFTVRHLQGRPIQILVQEGVVEVTRRNTANATPVRVRADTQTVVPHSASISIRAVTYSQVVRNLAWQYGQIAFDNEALEDAADEFARYSNTRIVVEPAIAKRTITGLFASNDPVGFAKAAAAVLNLRVEVGTKEVRIVH